MSRPALASTSSIAGGSAAGTATAAPVRYKALTKEVLTAVCRKHFTIRTVGSNSSKSGGGGVFRSTTGAAKLEYANQHGEGYDYSSSEAQSKLETIERYLKRATHLQLDGLKLTNMFPVPELALAAGQTNSQATDSTFSNARMLRVLYLHGNQLERIDNLSFCAETLSHLYLQQNNIQRMQNLVQLKALEKLYLGGNQIAVLEGFVEEEFLVQQQQQQQQQDGDSNQQQQRPAAPAPFYLTELHMDGQRLSPECGGLQLSIPSIQALSVSLTTLSLAHNGMDSDSILPLSLLSRLQVLNLSHNRIDDLRVVVEMCSYLTNLLEFDLRENPCNSGGPQHTAVTHKKYRDRVISASHRLQKLDEKEVSENQREFLHSLKEQKRIKRAEKAAAEAAGDGSAQNRELSEEEAKFAALHKAPSFPYAPKVLTLRTSTFGGAPGTQSVQGVGGFGAGSRHTHTMHSHGANSSTAVGNGAPYQPQHQQYQPSPPATTSASPFLDYDDDDENLHTSSGGGGGGGGGGHGGDGRRSLAAHGGDSQHQHSQSSLSAAPQSGGEGTASSMTFTGDPTRLNDLLQQRGLISAFGNSSYDSASQSLPLDSAAESARIRRASMNSLNQAPVGWDGGRTQHGPPPHSVPLPTSTSAAAAGAMHQHQRKATGGGAGTNSGSNSRSGSRAAGGKPATGK